MAFVAAAANATAFQTPTATNPPPQVRFSSSSSATGTAQIPEISVLSPMVTRVLGLNPGKFTLQGTNTYIIGNGARRVLIDTGEGQEEYHEKLAKYAALVGFEIEAVLITHWHGDHVGGVRKILEHAEERQQRKNPDEGGIIPTIYKYRLDDEVVAGLRPVEPQPHWEKLGESAKHGWQFVGVADGERLDFDGFSLTAHHTPGHAADHLVYWLEGPEETAMFSGDNVLGEGSTVFEDLGEYLDSLERMARVLARAGGSGSNRRVRVYPGHGHVIEDGHGKVREYIGHREQREREIVGSLRRHHQGQVSYGDGLRDGVSSVGVMEIVEDLYRAYPATLHGAAARGVVLHLTKLEREGRVESEHGKWRLVGEIGEEEWCKL